MGCFRVEDHQGAAALRQNFILLLAYIDEPYSSRSKLFLAFLDYDSRRASRRLRQTKVYYIHLYAISV